jgi:hypothetical protein
MTYQSEYFKQLKKLQNIVYHTRNEPTVEIPDEEIFKLYDLQDNLFFAVQKAANDNKKDFVRLNLNELIQNRKSICEDVIQKQEQLLSTGLEPHDNMVVALMQIKYSLEDAIQSLFGILIVLLPEIAVEYNEWVNSNLDNTLKGKESKALLDKLIEEKGRPPKVDTKRDTHLPQFDNNFDNVDPVEIYNHFKAELVDKRHLTLNELNKYLKAAFEQKKTPATLFKLKHRPSKQRIYKIFYVYYLDIAQKKHGQKKQYVALLCDFFEGFDTNTTSSNWSR